MNVSYENFNPADVASMLKMDKSTVNVWCKKGYINYQDVSEAGSKRPRYLIPDWEVNRIKKLINKYGRKKWLLYNENDKADVSAKHMLDYPCEFEVNQVPLDLTEPQIDDDIPTRREKIDPDKIMKTIMYIQDINDRLEDLEAEKNQLINEREACKKEVMEALER